MVRDVSCMALRCSHLSGSVSPLFFITCTLKGGGGGIKTDALQTLTPTMAAASGGHWAVAAALDCWRACVGGGGGGSVYFCGHCTMETTNN